MGSGAKDDDDPELEAEKDGPEGIEIEGPLPYDWDGWEIWIGAGAGAYDELDPELEPEKDGPLETDIARAGP